MRLQAEQGMYGCDELAEWFSLGKEPIGDCTVSRLTDRAGGEDRA